MSDRCTAIAFTAPLNDSNVSSCGVLADLWIADVVMHVDKPVIVVMVMVAVFIIAMIMMVTGVLLKDLRYCGCGASDVTVTAVVLVKLPVVIQLMSVNMLGVVLLVLVVDMMVGWYAGVGGFVAVSPTKRETETKPCVWVCGGGGTL